MDAKQYDHDALGGDISSSSGTQEEDPLPVITGEDMIHIYQN